MNQPISKDACPTCHGTGLAPDYKSVCAVCHGTGKRRGGVLTKRNPLITWTVRATTKAAALRGLAKSMEGTWYQVVSVKKKNADTYLITINTMEKRNPRKPGRGAPGVISGYRKIWFSGRGGITAGLVLSEQTFQNTRSVEAFSRLFPYSEANKMARFHKSPVFDTYEEAFGYPTGRNPSRQTRVYKNPSGKLQRLGRAVEVRYRREVGSKPGYYKHEIKSQQASLYTVASGWVHVPGRAILITEGKPHV